MTDRIVYLMRGLPACEKSYAARKAAGADGVICETDEYFYTQVGDDPTRYDYDADLLPAARRWNFDRFKQAVDAGTSPVVVDRGNGRNAETREYARYALDRGYRVELMEPESTWWKEIRALLKYKEDSRSALYEWADRLAEMSRATHRVPVSIIRHWMDAWRHDITLQDILDLPDRD